MEHSLDKPFVLSSRSEVEQFEQMSYAYAEARANFAIKHLSLVEAFDFCQQREGGGKVFAATLDIFINFVILWCDTIAAGAVWNEKFSKGRLEGGSVLESHEKFFGKMDMHRHNTAFIFRYRALWDKIMGVLIMIHAPERYEVFVSAKSRRRAFIKYSEGVAALPKDAVIHITSMLEGFDNEFRTPETHGTGALRKWSFTMAPMNEVPSGKLMNFWNVALDGMITLSGSLGQAIQAPD
jgi:hypothetical protein